LTRLPDNGHEIPMPTGKALPVQSGSDFDALVQPERAPQAIPPLNFTAALANFLDRRN
jgi:hypothetical protein